MSYSSATALIMYAALPRFFRSVTIDPFVDRLDLTSPVPVRSASIARLRFAVRRSLLPHTDRHECPDSAMTVRPFRAFERFVRFGSPEGYGQPPSRRP